MAPHVSLLGSCMVAMCLAAVATAGVFPFLLCHLQRAPSCLHGALCSAVAGAQQIILLPGTYDTSGVHLSQRAAFLQRETGVARKAPTACEGSLPTAAK